MNKKIDPIKELARMKAPIIDFCAEQVSKGKTIEDLRNILHPIELDEDMIKEINKKARKIKLESIK